MSQPLDFERESIERDRDLAWDLYEAQPEHPQIAQLTQSVLARAPEFTGMIILLSRHRTACGEIEEARRLLRDLLGRRDRQYLNALRDLRDLEYSDRQYVEYLRLSELVLREDSEADWSDRMDLGAATTFAVDAEAGWTIIDDAVEQCARTAPDSYAHALAMRCAHFLASSAPPSRFLVAAEQAIEADPTELALSTALAYAYLFEYRPQMASEILLRVLREDPMDEIAQAGMHWAEILSKPLESETLTMDDLRKAGLGEVVWRKVQEWNFGTSLGEAFRALESVMPDDLAHSLRPALDQQRAEEMNWPHKVRMWRDGQLPGTGQLWRNGQSFRLMSARENLETDTAIEQHPQNWLEWGAEAMTHYDILFTDDAGAYIFEGPGERLYRRAAGESDLEVAESLADWIWDRVAAFGGDDPRPWKPLRART